MFRSVLLLLPLLASAAPLHGQNTPPHLLPIPEQLRQNYYDMHGLTAALPGLVQVDPGVCVVDTYLVDTLGWADSARALFRHTRPRCEGPPEVRVHTARYTRDEMQTLGSRLSEILAEPGIRVRGYAYVHADGSITITAQNGAARERARERLLQEPGIPHASLGFRLDGPEEVDDPVHPPRAVYLAVLDSVAAHVHGGGGYGRIVAATLPAPLTLDDLRARGLRLLEPSDRCGTVGRIVFGEPRQHVDGTYVLRLLEGVAPGIPDDFYYFVRCDESGRCHIIRTYLSGGLLITGCPVDPQP